MSIRLYKVSLLFLLSLVLLLQTPAAYSDSVDDAAQDIYYQTLSPFCPGRALADCPTEQATILKAEIKSELQSGKSHNEVYEGILKKYGEHLRAAPTMRGWNALAWLAPVILLGIGVLIVVFKIRSKSQNDSLEQD